jgi:hypothetical protein
VFSYVFNNIYTSILLTYSASYFDTIVTYFDLVFILILVQLSEKPKENGEENDPGILYIFSK